MKTAIYTLIGILGCLQSCLAGPDGLWGGKWDDKWAVFLKVEPRAGSDRYTVQYLWIENSSDKAFSKSEYVAAEIGAYFEAGSLMFRVDGDKGMLYGAFTKPRMANLVRINGELPSVSECDSVLRKHQWKAGAIPAAEALAIIEDPNGRIGKGKMQPGRGAGPQAQAQDQNSLDAFLVGTKWLWHGSPRNAIIFKEDGTIEFPNNTNTGLVTRWEVTGKNQVKLNILKGRTTNTTATLEFASDRRSFTGIDFNGSSAIARSPRAQ
jgi:hypothetical protein